MPAAVWVGVLAATVTFATLLATLRFSAWTERSAGLFAAFAAGALVTVAILHLLPEAYAAQADAPIWVLAGFAGAYLFNRGVLSFAHDHGGEIHGPARATAVVATIGIAFHSLVDGLAYAVTFAFDWDTGAFTAVGLILHEAPEALVVYALQRQARVPVFAALIVTFLAAGLTTPLGAALAAYALPTLAPATLGMLLALAAGVLLFVGAGHLLPHVEHEPARRALPALLLGGTVVLAGLHLRGHPPTVEAAGTPPNHRVAVLSAESR